ncbi:MAG: helix-turn-helix transcriptional regulator [Actinomycetota bacterium]|jgi:poly-beta-hydroxybutyrate-responsive repressor|nr:helix-turn-helix transcriptional regulator [Actinomycetota bacterium]
MKAVGDQPEGLPRNYAQPCLLLLLAEGPSHGYDLLEQVGRLGLERTDTGGLYRTLRGMERGGLVRSWWETSASGPPRRTYELTDEGQDWLHVWAGALREVYRHLGGYLARYAAVTDSAPVTPR